MLCACFTTSGNNYFGEDIVRVLQEVKSEKRRAAYILMDRIRPRTDLNVLLRRGLPLKITSVCCELGICGAYVRYSIHSAMQHACDKMTKKQWQNRFLDEHGKTLFIQARWRNGPQWGSWSHFEDKEHWAQWCRHIGWSLCVWQSTHQLKATCGKSGGPEFNALQHKNACK